jgi:radical SAM superfamily enzyme YgiQ (UPF0313 family)
MVQEAAMIVDRPRSEAVRDSRPVVLAVAPNTDDLHDASARRGLVRITDMLGRMPNIGIMYLAAALEQAGYPAVTLDFQHEEPALLKVVGRILSLKPRLVGFTLYDSTMVSTAQCIALLRQVYDGPIVVGGYTATTHADDVFAYMPQIDYVIMREGEQAVVALRRCLDGECGPESVPNLVFRRGGGLVYNPEGPLMDVRQIPWPKRDWSNPSFMTPILARRGCFSKCTFCSMVRFYETPDSPIVRWREPKDVVDEIAWCVEHGASNFIFYDDDFGLSIRKEREWCARFIKELERRDLKFSWEIELRVMDVIRGAELLRELIPLGLSHLSIGMESMLPRQLKLYNKGYTQKDIFAAFDVLRTLPVEYQTNIIFWDPWSTLEEGREHLRLLSSVGFHEQLAAANYPFLTTTLKPRRGTAFYDRLEAEGMLKSDPRQFWSFSYGFADPGVRRFRAGPFQTFNARTHPVPRPQAIWLTVPRLEKLGLHERAAALRRYACDVSRAEMEYLDALLETCAAVRHPEDARRAIDDIHETLGQRTAEISRSEPPDACEILYDEIAGV